MPGGGSPPACEQPEGSTGGSARGPLGALAYSRTLIRLEPDRVDFASPARRGSTGRMGDGLAVTRPNLRKVPMPEAPLEVERGPTPLVIQTVVLQPTIEACLLTTEHAGRCLHGGTRPLFDRSRAAGAAVWGRASSGARDVPHASDRCCKTCSGLDRADLQRGVCRAQARE
jgi:hypothetical protein